MFARKLHALVLVILFGCGSEVIQTDDGGGGSGLGPNQGGNDPSTNNAGGGPNNGGGSVGGAPPTTNSGGTAAGGGVPVTPCEQVCINVETCFGVNCAMAGLDCSNPQADCPAACLQDASCDELIAVFNQNPSPEIAACLAGCQGGEGGAGGGPPQNCVPCLFQNQCLQPCMNQPGCQGWAPCAQGCQDPSCFQACNAQFPEAEPFYSQIYQCACDNCEGCEAQMDPCNQGAGGSAGTGGGG